MNLIIALSSLTLVSTSAFAGKTCYEYAISVGDRNVDFGSLVHTLQDKTDEAASGKANDLEKYKANIETYTQAINELNSAFVEHCVDKVSTLEMPNAEGKMEVMSCENAYFVFANDQLQLGNYLGELSCSEKKAKEDARSRKDKVAEPALEKLKEIAVQREEVRRNQISNFKIVVDTCVLKDKVIETPKATSTNTGNNG